MSAPTTILGYCCGLCGGYVQESPARLQGLIDYLGKKSSQKLG